MSQSQKVKYLTKKTRRTRRLLVKAGVWAFLALFVASIVGVVLTIQR